MAIITINNPDDPRISGFRDIRERDLTGREGMFVAEGEVVLNVLTSPQSLCGVSTLLLDAKRVEGLAPVLARLGPEVPVHVASQQVLDRIAGFHLHRGILALGRKPLASGLEAVLAAMPDQAVVVMACGMGNHDNMGGLFRNAAAFGAGAVILDEQCCDPFYRKAIRVSVGAVLRTPMATGVEAASAIQMLKEAGFAVLALTGGASQMLADAAPGGRVALVLGAEGPGLPQNIINMCQPVGIRMAAGFDSLNVATVSGIALHHFSQ